MNLQTQLSGQISGQVPNQAGTSLSGLPQQKGNPLPGHMQNPGVNRSVMNMDPEYVKARRFMTERIYEFLIQRRQQSLEAPPKKLLDIVRRLEEGLFKTATTKEEYVNLATLESRLHLLIRRMSNQNQQFSHANTSSSIGPMIPTPGLPQTGNTIPTRTSSVDSSNVANNGALPSGYQQPSSGFSISSGGNSMLTSMGVQRMTSQMIPTPGFSNPSNDINNNANNQSFMNPESSNVGAFPAVESTIVSQPVQQKQHVGGQNSRMLHNIGGHMGGGIRSTLQQTSYGLSNGSLNGGLGMIANNIPPMNGPGTSEGYLTGTMHGNSPKPSHPHFDQHQRPVMQGDRYEIGSSDASGSGNLHVPVESMMNDQNFNAVSLQSMPNANPPMMANQSNMHATQQVIRMKPHSTDQSEKMNTQSHYSGRENLVQSHQPQQFQKPFQFQRQQLGQHQLQQKQQSQNHQLLLKNDAFSESQLPSEIGSKVKSEPGTEQHDEDLHSQVPEQFQFADMQNQFPHNTIEDHSRSSQFLSHPSYPHDVCSSMAQTSEHMQQLSHPHQFAPNSKSDFNGYSGSVQLDSASSPHGQWNPKTHDGSLIAGKFLHDQTVPEEFRQRITGHNVAERNNLSSEESMIGQLDATKSAEPTNVSGTGCRSSNLNREQQFKNQQRWLLFLRHARRCPAPEGKCPDPNCINVQKLLRHMEQCSVFQCPYPRCRATRVLIDHHRRCRDASCPVCIPVKNFVQSQLKAFGRPDSGSGLPSSVNGSCKSYNTTEIIGMSTHKMSAATAGYPEDLHPNIKRLKIEQASQPLVSESESSVVPVPSINEHHSLQDAHHIEQHGNPCVTMEPEVPEVQMEIPVNIEQGRSKSIEMKNENSDNTQLQSTDGSPIKSKNSVVLTVQKGIKIEKELDQGKKENTSLPSENASKSGKPNIKGVSLTELFTPEQVREHIMGLRKWVGQSKAKAEKNQAMERSMSENSCQLCAVEKLTFEPPPIYCTPCGARIKRNAMYYTIGAGDTRHCFCIPCYNEARGDTIMADRSTIPKARLEKKKNDEETEEWWVQCDKCEAWQHQICALFNGRRNDGGQAEYTCPNCYLAEVERGERMPLPQSAVLGAKDLPRTILSDHIEQRLFRRLKQERQERARAQGRNYDEVPGAEALVVRVVSSVDKKLEVKQRFLEIFQEENYPSEFLYKSKVVLLFQKIEGVEVCLFGMYVQEFGSECQQPNHRRVYLSYLDSVKYFRPDIKTVTGEALRTFVYHEILIGYLEYCKLRGFTSCYIWACPPLKGEDYILYCHPEIQKTPKSDKLREWYLSMLRKAVKENIVADLTNLYDHFFVPNGKAKVTAARLPYFDGDYWPGAAEDMIYQLQQEEDGRKQHKKGSMKRTMTKRALKASGQTDLSGNASRDLLLMHKLGETISPMKEDFIMVHLQHACSHCCILMVSGNRWVCKQCKNFQLCDKCYESEQKLEDRDRHPINQKDKHVLYLVEISDVSIDTKDKDEILESEFFDTRQAFLSLCQGNHYQYDTLRRAKHSSMMVLYHLHNPTAPAFVTTCNVCQHDIEAGQGWRCETCPDYDVCNACYQKEGGINHPHKLTNQLSNERDAQNKEARQFRVQQLRKMLDLLVHASQCRSLNCQYPNCRKVKALFRHGMHCKIRASGGCGLCKKMWYLLQLHSRACKESQCSVPRCRDLNEHLRRLQQQSDSRRRAAVMEMMRQRAAEVAGNSG
ncbi:Histone acetyltransferase HAC12 [Forsythia ovata]|uniref:histone acetyltransferase n=1 Tax=Forsythia ovata TaxID=205694 RepID=A0ABD1WDN6_9LAMI